MSDTENRLEKVSKSLKGKLGKSKLGLSDYTLSPKEDVAPEVPSPLRTTPQDPHKTKNLKYTFYLSETAKDALNEAYIMHFSKDDKTNKSEIACLALVEYLQKLKKKFR